MPFPSPPWRLRGSMWMSLFACRPESARRPPGLYAAAFVDYVAGTLTYRELLVARLVREAWLPRVTVTDIWVDSVASRDGGRALWAIPKDLGDLHVRGSTRGRVREAAWDAGVSGAPVAAARFTSPRVPTLRTPCILSLSQTRDDGATVTTPVRGSSRNLPALAQWEFGSDGPLSWLAGRQPLVSLVVHDFRMTFGR